jgi:hypothetical protein
MNNINTSIKAFATIIVMVLITVCSAGATDQQGMPGSEEFGLTAKQLVQAIEEVEALICICMRDQGFQYISVDAGTVRKGMDADKNMPGISEEEFIEKYGFGITTFYTGKPPQLVRGYSPAKLGLGERNIQIYQGLSPADQVAYNRALLGENTDTTFAVGLETENFSRTGGCTRKAIEQVFEPEQLKTTYYNPKDALINKDPRMQAALRQYAAKMRQAGFSYNHPDEVEPDIREQLEALTRGGTILVETMSPEQQVALKRLQTYEQEVAVKSFELEEELIDPIEERIEKEMYAHKIQ